jgi:toxin ParE1/3/4
MKVVLTDAAYADLLQISRTIRAYNPARAETFVAEIYERCHGLGAMPLAFPLIPRFENKGIRRRVFGSYLIFYRVTATTVDVLHVLHGAQDFAAILFADEV